MDAVTTRRYVLVVAASFFTYNKIILQFSGGFPISWVNQQKLRMTFAKMSTMWRLGRLIGD